MKRFEKTELINMKLKRMILQNFMKYTHKEIDFNKNKTQIFGENGSGKTTIQTAYIWVLTDKDLNGNNAFEIKTKDVFGEVQHGLDHSVELVIIDDNNQEISLKKIYKEDYSTIKGTGEKIFKGHKTDCLINNMPFAKTKFEEWISIHLFGGLKKEIYSNLLTITSFANLHYSKQRELLFEAIGCDFSINLPEDLKVKMMDLTPEKYRENLSKKLTALNKEIEADNTRISENALKIPENFEENKEFANNLSFLESQKRKVLQEKVDAQELHNKKQNEVIARNKKITDLKRKIEDLERDNKDLAYAPLKELTNQKSELLSQKTTYESTKNNLEKDINEITEKIEKNKQDVRVFGESWKEKNKEVFTEILSDCVCPTCKREFDAETRSQILETQKTDFDLSKKLSLNEIVKKANSLNAENEDLAKTLEFKQTSLNALAPPSTEEFEEIEKKITEFNPKEATKTKEQKELEKEVKELENIEIEEFKTFAFEKQELLESLEKQIEDIKLSQQSEIEAINAQKRIKELEEDLSQKRENFLLVEKDLYELKNYMKARMESLTAEVNDNFEIVKFVLFEDLIGNDDYKNVCHITVDGVIYGKGLNTAKMINAGIDIVNFFSKKYEIFSPLFIDNKESVTSLLNTKNQTIELIVDENQKEILIK